MLPSSKNHPLADSHPPAYPPPLAREPAKPDGAARHWAVCQALIYCLVAAAMGWTGYLTVQSPYTTMVLATDSDNGSGRLGGIDALFKQATARGNAVVHFHGFPAGTGGGLVNEFYFRGNYAVYPRRLFVADDGERFDPKRVATGEFAPSEAWLDSHDVRCIVFLDVQAGGLNYRLEMR